MQRLAGQKAETLFQFSASMEGNLSDHFRKA